MMNAKLNEMIEKILPEVLENAARVQAINRMMQISGERDLLPLNGRNIDIAYYRCGKPNPPLIVGLHGGGFLMGGCYLDDDLWTNVTGKLEMDVVSIGYRMSPDVMDHDCLHDVYDSILYLKEHADDYGFDREHICVLGCSAGGNLAAAAALLAAQRKDIRFDWQILIYPFLDGATDPDLKGDGSFSGLMPHIMNRLHFSPDKAKDPFLSPAYADPDMLAGTAAAIVVYCENDNLRPEAVRYCEQLRNAGVPVSEFYAKDMPHGYFETGFKKRITEMDIQFLGENGAELAESGLLRTRCDETLEFIKASIRHS